MMLHVEDRIKDVFRHYLKDKRVHSIRSKFPRYCNVNNCQVNRHELRGGNSGCNLIAVAEIKANKLEIWTLDDKVSWALDVLTAQDFSRVVEALTYMIDQALRRKAYIESNKPKPSVRPLPLDVEVKPKSTNWRSNCATNWKSISDPPVLKTEVDDASDNEPVN